MLFFKYFSKLPFFVLYGISDFANFLTYRIIGYRKKVVFENLQRSFPEKSQVEIKQIAKDFYRHFTDTFVEFLKGYSITKEDLLERVKVKNVALLKQHLNNNQSIILITGHNGNWEWMFHAVNLQDIVWDAVYQKLSNPFIDRLTLFIRSRFVLTPLIEKNETMRKMIERKDIVRGIAMASDQAPQQWKVAHWTTFMNQDSPFFTGTERMARKFEYPVFFCRMRKVKRGFYEAEFIEIANPKEYANLPVGAITERFANALEQTIRENPSDYLWTHRRWKHKRTPEDVAQSTPEELKS